MDNDIRTSLMAALSTKLDRIGINPRDLGDDFDLVKSGLVNSLEFVDLVTRLEQEFHCEIDFEKWLEKGGLTTLKGLMKAFEDQRNAGPGI